MIIILILAVMVNMCSTNSLVHTAVAQEIIYKHQHPANCGDVDWVYSHYQDSGIGSEIHVATAALALAMNRNGVLLWSPSRWMKQACPLGTFDCVFLPISSCTLQTVNPKRLIKANLFIGPTFPNEFMALDTAPFPRLYWWRAQGANYLTRYNAKFARVLNERRVQLFQNRTMPCGTVCAFVRHGLKFVEMEMLSFTRHWSAIQSAHEMLRNAPVDMCRHRKQPWSNQVFVATDDPHVLDEARSVVGDRLLRIDYEMPRFLPHESEHVSRILDFEEHGTTKPPPCPPPPPRSRFLTAVDSVFEWIFGSNKTAAATTPTAQAALTTTSVPTPAPAPYELNFAAYYENWIVSFLQLELCLECDAFVGQRQGNFFRLIDELRMTRKQKLSSIVIEVGVYSFDW
jgi:hypothetical protein